MSISSQKLDDFQYYHEPQAKKFWIDEEEQTMNVILTDGRAISVPLAFYPFLIEATKEERHDFRLFAENTGIHFNALDEDISVEHLLLGRKQLPNHSIMKAK